MGAPDIEQMLLAIGFCCQICMQVRETPLGWVELEMELELEAWRDALTLSEGQIKLSTCQTVKLTGLF